MGCGASTGIPPSALSASTPMRKLQQSAKHLDIGSADSVRVADLLLAKKALRAASATKVGSQVSIVEVQSAILKMELGRDHARLAGAYGGPEAAVLEARLTSLHSIAKAREEAAASTTIAASVSAASDTAEIRRVVSGVLTPALAHAAAAKAVDAPEASILKRRLSELEGWLIAKDAMTTALLKTKGLNGAAPLSELQAVVKQMAKAAATARSKKCESGPEAAALREAQAKVAPLATAKEALLRASESEGRDHKLKLADVRKAIERMQLAREEARASGAYDGMEGVAFEARLAALSTLASAKEAMSQAMSVAQSVDVADASAELRRMVADALSPALVSAGEANVKDTTEASALKRRLAEIEGWLVAKHEMAAAVTATAGAERAQATPVELKAAIKTIEKTIQIACKHEAWFLKSIERRKAVGEWSHGAIATDEGKVLDARLELARQRMEAKVELKAASSAAGALSTATPEPKLQAALERMRQAKTAASAVGAFEGPEADALAGKLSAAIALLGLTDSIPDRSADSTEVPKADLAKPASTHAAAATTAPTPHPIPACASPAAVPPSRRPILTTAVSMPAPYPVTTNTQTNASEQEAVLPEPAAAAVKLPELHLSEVVEKADARAPRDALSRSDCSQLTLRDGGDPFPSLTPPFLSPEGIENLNPNSKSAVTAINEHEGTPSKRKDTMVEDPDAQGTDGGAGSSTDQLPEPVVGVPLFAPFLSTGGESIIVQGSIDAN